MTMIRENGNMSNGQMIHDPAVWHDFTQVLDDAYKHWDAADQLAAARNREDEERNAEADRRAAWYDDLKRQARAILGEGMSPPWIRQDGPATYSAPRKGGVMEVRNVR